MVRRPSLVLAAVSSAAWSPSRRRPAYPSRRRSAAARSSSGRRRASRVSQRLPSAVRCRQPARRDLMGLALRARSASRRPRFTRTGRTSSRASTYTTHAAVHADVPHPPRGALERRRARSRRATSSFTHDAIARSCTELREPDAAVLRRFASARPSTRRRSGSSFAPVSPTGASLFQRVLPSHALRGQDFSTVWLDGIDNPKTGTADRERPVPRRELGARHAVRSSATLATGEPPRVPRPARRPFLPAVRRDYRRAGRVDADGRGRRRHSHRAPDAQVQELRGHSRDQGAAGQGANWEHLDLRVARAGIPLLESKLVRQALAYGIDRDGSRASALRCSSTLATRRATARCSSRQRPLSPELAALPVRPAEARTAARAGGLPPGADGIYVCDGRAALAATHDGRGQTSRRAQTLELIQRQLRQVGIEIVPAYAPPNILFGQIFEAATSTSRSSRGSRSPDSSGGVDGPLRLRRRPEPHRLLPAARDARPRPGDRILDPARQARAEPSRPRSWRGTCR